MPHEFDDNGNCMITIQVRQAPVPLRCVLTSEAER
jgi:hypothetical protein